MTKEDDVEIRLRLMNIGIELGGLATDNFAGKHALNLEADELRRRLSETSDKDDELLKSWASRAGKKNAQVVDDNVEFAKALIQSRGEGGGGSG